MNIRKALMEHAPVKWSDGTYSCPGCKRSAEAAAEEAIGKYGRQDERAREAIRASHRAAYPEWTYEQWVDHIVDVTSRAPSITQVDVKAAKLAKKVNEKLGVKTPKWVEDIAGAEVSQ